MSKPITRPLDFFELVARGTIEPYPRKKTLTAKFRIRLAISESTWNVKSMSA
jgi:hypothetical protein